MPLGCQERVDTIETPAADSLHADSLYFVFLNTNPDRGALPESRIMELQQGHMANIQRLATQGDLLAAGPFAGGGGIFILKGGSVAGVGDTLESDPAIAAGRFKLEIFPMRVAGGRLISRPADYPFEMVQLSFLRYRDQAPISVPDLWFHAAFTAEQGGIMLSNVNADSLTQELVVDSSSGVEIRTIWIARDLFHESPTGKSDSLQ